LSFSAQPSWPRQEVPGGRCARCFATIYLALTLWCAVVSVWWQMFALLVLSGLAAPGGKGLWSDMFNPCKARCSSLTAGRLLPVACIASTLSQTPTASLLPLLHLRRGEEVQFRPNGLPSFLAKKSHSVSPVLHAMVSMQALFRMVGMLGVDEEICCGHSLRGHSPFLGQCSTI